MTCVLRMICNREREIRNFVKTPFYRVNGKLQIEDYKVDAEWKAVENTKYFETPFLYKENGFKERKTAEELIEAINVSQPVELMVKSITKKDEKKQPPLLFNLAELQNDCSRLFKINPDETLNVVQELYEKKLVTYPRTDARVLSTAVSKEIYKNINGLRGFTPVKGFAENILKAGSYKGLEKTKYVDDKKITDHYAIIPTGQGLNGLNSLKPVAQKVYVLIVRRFLSIFYPPAIYKKASLIGNVKSVFKDGSETMEQFGSNFKILVQKGYFEIVGVPGEKKSSKDKQENDAENQDGTNDSENQELTLDSKFFELLKNIKKNDKISMVGLDIKEGETKPPKRYNSGSLILAMENAGQLIEDEDLRAQIKGSGIGTSATRAGIITKLQKNEYIKLNSKTQIVTPMQLGEMVYGVVYMSIRSLLNPELTASWELGLTKVAEGEITADEYMKKLDDFIRGRTDNVLRINNANQMVNYYNYVAQFYRRNK